jgi:hypothetical protein
MRVYNAETPVSPSPIAGTDAGLKVANFFGFIFLIFLFLAVVGVIVGSYYYKDLDKPTGVAISLVKDTSLVKPVYPNTDDDTQKSWFYIPYLVTWNPSKYNAGYMVYVGTEVPLSDMSQVVAMRTKQDVSQGTTYTAMVPIDINTPPAFIYAGVASNYSILGGLKNVQSGISEQTNSSKTPFANVFN